MGGSKCFEGKLIESQAICSVTNKPLLGVFIAISHSYFSPVVHLNLASAL